MRFLGGAGGGESPVKDGQYPNPGWAKTTPKNLIQSIIQIDEPAAN